MNTSKKIKVAVIYGGQSGEHPISCATAGSVMAAINPDRYEIIPIGIRRDGTWVPGVNDPQALALGDATTEVPPSEASCAIACTQPPSVVTFSPDGAISRQTVDVVVPLLHGPFGEDGTIQGLCEMAGVPYVGSGVFASAAGMDKHFMKMVLESAGLPVGPYVVIPARSWRRENERQALREACAQLEFPLFVKPARAGSSLGISKVHSMEELDGAIEAAHVHDPKVIVEQGIVGREVECAVIEGHGADRPRASVLGEVLLADLGDGFYDFSKKYVQTDGLTMSIPAEVEPAISDTIRDLAVRTFEAFECEGMARVDFFLTPEGEPIVNEINTIPGFTPFSMYPVLWQHTGLEYSALIDELIALALERPVGLR